MPPNTSVPRPAPEGLAVVSGNNTKTPARKSNASSMRETESQNDEKTESTTSLLAHPLRIEFSDTSALARRDSNVLPRTMYRWSHDKSATLAKSMPGSNHSGHREVPGLILKEGNEFQSVGTLKPNLDFTLERITRHFKPTMIRQPTPFVSATSSLEEGEKQVKSLHKTRPYLKQAITKFTTSGLIPATLKATMYTTINTHVPKRKGPILTRTETRDVEIPIWILEKTPYSGDLASRPSCEVDDVLNAGGIFWFSVEELKNSDLNVWAKGTHQSEWLAVSSIPTRIITQHMPFDGMVLHTGKSAELIQARGDEQRWNWNWDTNRWDHEPDLTDFRPYRLAKFGDKRKFFDDDDDDASEPNADAEPNTNNEQDPLDEASDPEIEEI